MMVIIVNTDITILTMLHVRSHFKITLITIVQLYRLSILLFSYPFGPSLLQRTLFRLTYHLDIICLFRFASILFLRVVKVDTLFDSWISANSAE
jgi:hypothetical protein